MCYLRDIEMPYSFFPFTDRMTATSYLNSFLWFENQTCAY